MEFKNIFSSNARRPKNVKIYYAYDYIVAGLKFYCGDKAEWLPEYDKVVSWLSDNKGKGLLLKGDAGRGKSLLCRLIIPQILNQKDKDLCGVMTAYEMARKGDHCFHRGILMIDDLGVEDDHNEFGARLNTFCEIVDNAEQNGWILIITTNMEINEMEARYGKRTVDRLRALVNIIELKGESLRNGGGKRNGLPNRIRAYGVDFDTQEEADAFKKQQDEYYAGVESGKYMLAPNDNKEYWERQPLRLWRGKLCALMKYNWDKLGE